MLSEASASIQDVQASYTFSDADAVARFLGDNASLIPVLLAAPQAIADHFEGNPPLALECVSDPGDMGPDHLRLLILTALPVNDALDRLHQLDTDWLYRVLPSTHQKLIVDVEFV